MAKASTSAAIETQSKKVADSAKKLKESSVRIEDSADRRTELASNRTALAAERTYSAWIRTGLFSLASGAGAKGVLTGLMPTWIVIADCQRADRVQHLLFLRGGLAIQQVGSNPARSRRAADRRANPDSP